MGSHSGSAFPEPVTSVAPEPSGAEGRRPQLDEGHQWDAGPFALLELSLDLSSTREEAAAEGSRVSLSLQPQTLPWPIQWPGGSHRNHFVPQESTGPAFASPAPCVLMTPPGEGGAFFHRTGAAAAAWQQMPSREGPGQAVAELAGSGAPGSEPPPVEPPASMASEFKKKIFWRAVVAEFLAMTLFVFISIGSALGFQYPVGSNQTAVQDNVKVSLAFGLSIATLAQSVGHISGAHLNPAVTLGLLLSCQISILRAVLYIIAQCVGAIVATAILSGVTSSLPMNSLGRNDLAPGVNSGQGLGIEIIGTLQLVLCVLATTDRRRRDLGGSAPLAIGFSVALGHLLAIDYTGCGINPARSFGSAVLTHNFNNHWIFWVGPFIGGALAVLIYDFILAPRSSDLTDRMKVWTSGQVEEYDLDGDDINSRVEMKPK
uniref:Aquaporin-1 n=2 Tax=Leporidae TaxID=9979 RepID=G1TN20_RABIT